MRYFHCEDGFIGVTNQCPKGMKGLVYVGRGPQPGQGIESVGEQEYSRNQLEKLKRVPAEDVPDDWFAAIGLEQCPEPRTVELVIQFPWENRNKRKPAKPGSRRRRQERTVFCIALAISVMVACYVVFVWQYQ